MRHQDDETETDDYFLTPINDEQFNLIMEGHALWQRWVMAAEEGTVGFDSPSPLPEDKDRYQEIKSLTEHLFRIDSVKEAKGLMREDPRAEKSKYYNHSFLKLQIKWV